MKALNHALAAGLVVLFAGVGTSVGAGAAATEPAKSPDILDTSFVTADGARTLQESVVIDAPAAVLWKAFVDTEEFKRWNSPVAAIDLRVGGSLEASYDAKHAIGDPDNIKHRILTFLPGRLIVFQNIQAPRQLPDAQAFQRTVTVLEYTPLGEARTRVTISSTGWAGDAASDRLYAFFKAGNAELLEKMKSVYEVRAAR
jgi:uncharacterized protein YndB with AHSA1/START domain